MAKKLITQLRKHPQIKAFQNVADDATEIIEAICLILPTNSNLLGLIREKGPNYFDENLDEYPEFAFIPESEFSGFGAGFSVQLNCKEHQRDWVIKSRVPDYKQRIEQLNYCFGRYIKDPKEVDQDHWSLDLEVTPDPTDGTILHISFYSDDSTY